MLREAMLEILTDQASIPEIAVRQHCLALPADAPDDRLQSPHGDSLIRTNCEVIPDQLLDRQLPAGWTSSRYRWTSVFTAEDKGGARMRRIKSPRRRSFFSRHLHPSKSGRFGMRGSILALTLFGRR
jgi:hypothetical protein